MDLKLKDRVVVVTGGSAGIGHATVKTMLDEGARSRLDDSLHVHPARLMRVGRPRDQLSRQLQDEPDAETAPLLHVVVPLERSQNHLLKRVHGLSVQSVGQP